jgi:hypothetical protein
MHSLFDDVFVASVDGAMLSRVRHGEDSTDLTDIGDREYFQRAMRTGLPVVSRPIIGRITKTPVIIAEKLHAAVERYELRWEGMGLSVGARSASCRWTDISPPTPRCCARRMQPVTSTLEWSSAPKQGWPKVVMRRIEKRQALLRQAVRSLQHAAQRDVAAGSSISVCAIPSSMYCPPCTRNPASS